MPRWRVDYIGKGGKHLGTVEAADEKSAIAEAAKEFHIPPARLNKLVVTRTQPQRSAIEAERQENGLDPVVVSRVEASSRLRHQGRLMPNLSPT